MERLRRSGEATSYSATASGAPLLSRSFGRDAIDRITQATEALLGGHHVLQT